MQKHIGLLLAASLTTGFAVAENTSDQVPLPSPVSKSLQNCMDSEAKQYIASLGARSATADRAKAKAQEVAKTNCAMLKAAIFPATRKIAEDLSNLFFFAVHLPIGEYNASGCKAIEDVEDTHLQSIVNLREAYWALAHQKHITPEQAKELSDNALENFRRTDENYRIIRVNCLYIETPRPF